jgi:hypothetical protein
MATQSTSVQWSVVPPDAQTQKIGNILDAPRILADKIENLQQEIVTAEAAFYESLAKDLAAAPLKVEKAIEDYIALKAKIAALAAKIQAGEELGPIIEKLIQELKTTQTETLKAVIRRKLDQLQKEAEVEKDKAELIEKQIESLTKLLGDLEKPTSAAVAKRKKR